jgi:anti-sigma regulatory factor (Ser/Thr protein kinase)
MFSIILSCEFDDVVFLRFDSERKNLDLNEGFDEIRKAKRKFIVADFGLNNDASDEILFRITAFANEISTKHFWKLCFVTQNENLREKIKIVSNNTNLKTFHNLSDAINYFYWDCCKIREVVSMKMPSDISLVPSVRTCISDFVSLCKTDRKTVFQIELIIDELCNNAIEHGTQDLSKTIEVQCGIDEEKIELSVYNGYSTRKVKEKTAREIEENMEKWADSPNRTEDTFRGRGLGIVKKYSDSFEISSSSDGTWVYTIKRKGSVTNANTN